MTMKMVSSLVNALSPWSKIPSHITFTCLFIIAVIGEFTLDIKNPENNGFQMLGFQFKDFETEDGAMCDLVGVMMPLSDLRDLKNYSAVLSPDGTAMIIRIVSHPLVYFDDVHLCYGKGNSTQLERAQKMIMKSHQIYANSMMGNNRERLRKQIIVHFPDGIKCNTKYFNTNQNEQNGLKTSSLPIFVQLRLDPRTHVPINQDIFNVSWMLAVEDDHERRIVKAQVVDDYEDELKKTLELMSESNNAVYNRTSYNGMYEWSKQHLTILIITNNTFSLILFPS